MIVSMTGYGRFEKEYPNCNLIVEIKSLNSKYLDVHTKLHEYVYKYENDIISLLRKKCNRGKFYIGISIKENNYAFESIKLNKNKLNTYINQIAQLQKVIQVNDSVSLDYLLKIPDLFESKVLQKLFKDNKAILYCVNQAVHKLMEHRGKDGKVLEKDISSKIKKINRDIKKIIRLSSSNSKKELRIIRNKINNIIPEIHLDSNRLYQEVGLIIEKKDINEELSRLNGHMELLEEYIMNDDNIGKKINFLLQEVNREVNTIGSKVDKISIKHIVVDIKNNVEKIREQVQNIL